MTRWLLLGAALVVLNFALTFHNVWPTPWITTRYELSVEIAVLVLLLALYSETVRVPSRRAMTGLAAVLMVLCIGRYAEVTAPALYGRRVNLYWDAPHLLNVAAMLADAVSPFIPVLFGLGVSALILSLFFVLRWSLSRLREGMFVPSSRRALMALSSALVVLYVAGHTRLPLRTLAWFSLPVTMTYWEQADFTLDAYRQARSGEDMLCPESTSGSDLTRVAGADIFVVFLESYGATAYDDPEIAAALATSREELGRAIAGSGREVVSAHVESPTFGGGSWLAHMSLLAERPVENNGVYNLLLTQECEVLTHAFAGRGYRVVGLMPGLKGEWPEGTFYGFDALYGERALQYAGPEFGWWRIPDQYALAKLDEMELTDAPRAPRFVFFPTISSHMPFRPTPPYQPDWSRILSQQPYDSDLVAESLAVEPDWANPSGGYVAAIRYAFDYMGGYLLERPDLDLILVLVGDHQPPASVSGRGSRWDVPVHVIASRRELLDGLLDAGFVGGLEPEHESIGPMHDLAKWLLQSPAIDSGGVDTGLRRR